MFAMFQEDEGAGYFFVYKPETQEVLAQVRVYEAGHNFPVHENDVQVRWARRYGKCGVSIWGRMRGVIDLVSGQECSIPLERGITDGITDPQWLMGFNNNLDSQQFFRARQRYWKEIVKEHEPHSHPLPEEQTPIETNFISEAAGPDGMFAVFEDDGATGYLYAYKADENSILRHVHIYDRSPQLNVRAEQVQVLWSEEGSKCGVSIWERMRGIIDLGKGREGRVWLETRDTPGIGDAEWLRGFDVRGTAIVEVHDSVVSPDGALKVTLIAFDPRTGEGRVKIEELHRDKGRFYVTIKYGEAGQHRIDYKAYDVYKASEFPFRTNRNDGIKAIEIVRVPAD